MAKFPSGNNTIMTTKMIITAIARKIKEKKNIRWNTNVFTKWNPNEKIIIITIFNEIFQKT